MKQTQHHSLSIWAFSKLQQHEHLMNYNKWMLFFCKQQTKILQRGQLTNFKFEWRRCCCWGFKVTVFHGDCEGWYGRRSMMKWGEGLKFHVLACWECFACSHGRGKHKQIYAACWNLLLLMEVIALLLYVRLEEWYTKGGSYGGARLFIEEGTMRWKVLSCQTLFCFFL